MKKNNTLVYVSLVGVIALGIGLTYFYIKMLDKIPVEYQALLIISLCIVCMEGIGLKAVADYVEIDNSFLLYIPIVRYFGLSQILENTDYEKLGKIKLPFFISIIFTIVLAVSILMTPGTIKAAALVATYALGALLLIVRTIYLFAMTKSISDSMIQAILHVLLFPQPVLVFLAKRQVKLLAVNDEIEYEE